MLVETRRDQITGCSSGFGEQLVRSALARGDKVIATGRNAATRLKHLEDTGAAIIDLDVTLLEADVKTRVDAAVAVYGQIDVLVNNAGVAAFGTFEEYRQALAFPQPAISFPSPLQLTGERERAGTAATRTFRRCSPSTTSAHWR